MLVVDSFDQIWFFYAMDLKAMEKTYKPKYQRVTCYL